MTIDILFCFEAKQLKTKPLANVSTHCAHLRNAAQVVAYQSQSCVYTRRIYRFFRTKLSYDWSLSFIALEEQKIHFLQPLPSE